MRPLHTNSVFERRAGEKTKLGKAIWPKGRGNWAKLS